jgi:hypothetical protein
MCLIGSPRGYPIGKYHEKQRNAKIRREKGLEAACLDIRARVLLREAGECHGVSGKTAWARMNGRKSLQEIHKSQQALTNVEGT